MIKSFIGSFVDFLKASALAWVILLAVALLLALPSQILEYYRVAAIELAVWQWSDLAAKICLFAAVVGIVGYMCVVALNLSQQDNASAPDALAPQRRRAEAVAASIAILLPFAGVVVGLIRANVEQQPGPDDAVAVDLIGKAYFESVFDNTGKAITDSIYKDLIGSKISNWLYAFAATVAAIACALIIASFIGPVARGFRALADRFSRHSGLAFLIFLAVFAACSYAIFHGLHDWSVALGTFGFLTLGLGLGLLLITSLACFSRKVRLPLCFAFLVWPIAIAIIGLNDNDKLRDWNAKSNSSSPDKPDRFAAYFERQIRGLSGSALTDREDGTPIYIVAAPGGGLYASYFASTVLTHAAEEVPSFRKHLVAISSVSGGSLGAALFSSLYLDNESCSGYVAPNQLLQPDGTPDQLSRLYFLRRFHEFDFLAPVVGALLFLDSVQAFVPVPIPSLDRARAFEASILSAWAEAKRHSQEELLSVILERAAVPANLKTTTGRPLDCPIGKVFGSQPNGPVILFNVTEVRTGRQRVLSPFAIEAGFQPAATNDVKLVTAAALSARFPYVTPPGWFASPNGSDTERVYLVDGGYYENSGVSTAQAMVRKLDDLRNANPGLKFKIRLIVLVGPTENPSSTDRYLSELLSPIRALGRSRSARGHNYIAEVSRSLPQCGSPKASPGSDCQLIIGMRNFLYPLPLGWDMSEMSRFVIESQRGKFDKCHKDTARGLVNGACFIQFLKADLD